MSIDKYNVSQEEKSVKRGRPFKGQKKDDKQQRKRNWLFVIYPGDSAPDNWLELLQGLCVEGCVSPLHDNTSVWYNNCMDYKSNCNVVYSCKYHVVWCPKYRRKVLVNGVDERLKSLTEAYKESPRRYMHRGPVLFLQHIIFLQNTAEKAHCVNCGSMSIIGLLFVVVVANSQHHTKESRYRRTGGNNLFPKRKAPNRSKRRIQRAQPGNDNHRHPLQNIVNLIWQFHNFPSFP